MRKKAIKQRESHSLLRRILALSVGGPLFVIGIVLIPLPGPGVLVTFISLYILSLGFPSVDDKYNIYKQKLNSHYKSAKQKQDHFLDKHDIH